MKIKRIEPWGSIVHFTENCTTFRLNRKETREILNYQGKWPKDLTAPEIVHLPSSFSTSHISSPLSGWSPSGPAKSCITKNKNQEKEWLEGKFLADLFSAEKKKS